MWPSAYDAFVAFISHFEGVTTWMYLDKMCLVTTGIGDLIDPIEYALSLPWMKKDGTEATKEEIAAEWHRIKSLTSMALRGGMVFASIATLHLTPEGVQILVHKKMNEMWNDLVDRFPDLETWPADAQLGLLSMAWAAGQHFRAPHFELACKTFAFDVAANECGLHTPRDSVNFTLFRNAARVHEAEMDPSVLHYPTIVISEVRIEGNPPSS